MSRHKKSPPKGPAPAGSTNAGASAQAREDYSKFSQSVKRGGIRTGQTTERPAYWAVLPASVRYDETLPASAKLLFAEISSLAEATGFCFASNEYFAGLYAMSERTVQRHIKALESGGHIVIVDGDGGSGRRKIYAGANPLRGNPDKNVGVAEGTPTKMSPNPDIFVAATLYNKNNNNTPQSPPGGERAEERAPKRKGKTPAKGQPESKKAPPAMPDWKPERFEKFWNYYPAVDETGRKPARARAAKAWDKLRLDDGTIDRMAAALRDQKKSKLWKRKVGIPYASTWLNGRMWEEEHADELDEDPEEDEADDEPERRLESWS